VKAPGSLVIVDFSGNEPYLATGMLTAVLRSLGVSAKTLCGIAVMAICGSLPVPVIFNRTSLTVRTVR